MESGTSARIEELLTAIPGAIRVARLDDRQCRKVVEIEAAYETTSVIPVRNIGVRLLAVRESCLALLKDARFRAPKVPTVYLVEEAGAAPGGSGSSGSRTGGVRRGEPRDTILVDGVRYRVVGEEKIAGRDFSSETVMPLEDSFVIFPDRRSGPGVPCTFILPPVSFPELENEAPALGIADVLSVSPSLAADAWIRETFGFPPSNALATLLIGFNRAPAAGRS